MRMTNIDVSIIIVNYDITSLVVNAIDSLFHKIKDLTIEIKNLLHLLPKM